MSSEKSAPGARKTIGDIAPKLAEITDDVLFGDVWERPELSKRDRSLITCAALIATGKTEQMIEEIRPGDVVTVGPGEKHWHGAAPTTTMTHIAIQEALDGKNVEWLEKVTDEQYNARDQAEGQP